MTDEVKRLRNALRKYGPHQPGCRMRVSMGETSLRSLRVPGADEQLFPTGEVAARCGVTVERLKKWKRRGDLPSAPRGNHGMGRGHELLWSNQAMEEALARSREIRGHDFRRPGRLNDRHPNTPGDEHD